MQESRFCQIKMQFFQTKGENPRYAPDFVDKKLLKKDRAPRKFLGKVIRFADYSNLFPNRYFLLSCRNGGGNVGDRTVEFFGKPPASPAVPPPKSMPSIMPQSSGGVRPLRARETVRMQPGNSGRFEFLGWRESPWREMRFYQVFCYLPLWTANRIAASPCMPPDIKACPRMPAAVMESF